MKILLEAYEDGIGKIAKSVQGLFKEHLDARIGPGKWTIRQVAVHLLDSDLEISYRIKSVLAQDIPLLFYYDETKWAEKLFYEVQNLELVTSLFDLNRRITADILKRIKEEDFERKGVHTVRGLVSVRGLVMDAVNHLGHHLKFIEGKRKSLGKENISI
ncbi:MAG: DinB family protein [Leptospira sp.]|nr:DinB family protein [Leptospira sp.]